MEDFLGTTEHAVGTDFNHAAPETREATSEEVKLECDLWHSALRNQAAPYLSEMHTAVKVSQLADIVHELGWLDVAEYQGVRSTCTADHNAGMSPGEIHKL